MLRTAQLRMLRLIIQTKRTCEHKKELGDKDIRDDEMSEATQEEEDSTHDEYDQDSSISYDDDEEGTAIQDDD